MRRYTGSVAFNRAVGVVLLVVLTGLPAAATRCLALCAAPAESVQTEQAPADHQHGSAHDHGASSPVPSIDDPGDAGAQIALRGLVAGCETHGSAAREGPVALAAGRADVSLLGAAPDPPVWSGVPTVIVDLSRPRAGPPVAGSSRPGVTTSAPIPLALRI
jgi:hypothetical protein